MGKGIFDSEYHEEVLISIISKLSFDEGLFNYAKAIYGKKGKILFEKFYQENDKEVILLIMDLKKKVRKELIEKIGDSEKEMHYLNDSIKRVKYSYLLLAYYLDSKFRSLDEAYNSVNAGDITSAGTMDSIPRASLEYAKKLLKEKGENGK
ncbi:hypothetical protein ACFLZZ_04650 [Nanoarchaeota archaeon]